MTTPRPPRPLTRVSARLRAPWLDRQLAAGKASWSSPAHAARALQLTSPRRRRSTARSLEALIERADRPRAGRLTAVIAPCREQVRDALGQIVALSSRLRSPEPVEATAMARLHQLLCDGCGPCYSNAQPGVLVEVLEAIGQCLEVTD